MDVSTFIEDISSKLVGWIFIISQLTDTTGIFFIGGGVWEDSKFLVVVRVRPEESSLVHVLEVIGVVVDVVSETDGEVFVEEDSQLVDIGGFVP